MVYISKLSTISWQTSPRPLALLAQDHPIPALLYWDCIHLYSTDLVTGIQFTSNYPPQSMLIVFPWIVLDRDIRCLTIFLHSKIFIVSTVNKEINLVIIVIMLIFNPIAITTSICKPLLPSIYNCVVQNVQKSHYSFSTCFFIIL